MTIALYGRRFNEEDMPFIRSLVDAISSGGSKVVVEKNFLTQFPDDLHNLESFTAEAGVADANCLVSIGGDGTMLDTVTLVRNSGIPVLGINTGRLGFLASINRDQLQTAVRALLSGNFTTDMRSLIHLEMSQPGFGALSYALNDFTVHKKDTAAMIVIHVRVNGELMASYWADGLIVATPTGSTAYNLSCGGPVIFPDSASFVITPIAPHQLTSRPVIVNDSSEISIEVGGRAENFLASLDSRSIVVDASSRFVVTREKFPFNLVKLQGQDFMQTLRNKLMWAADRRN